MRDEHTGLAPAKVDFHVHFAQEFNGGTELSLVDVEPKDVLTFAECLQRAVGSARNRSILPPLASTS